jgi:Protein of unknown function (DUF1045)
LTPAVRMLGGFAAVVPAAASPALDELAAKCTTIFDAFRAPMTAQERARRVASGLNQGQVANLDRWGYPYVFSDFRFHMTLTGRIDAKRRDDVLAMLQKAFSRACKDRALAIERISLVRQNDENSPFRVIEQATLRAAR